MNLITLAPSIAPTMLRPVVVSPTIISVTWDPPPYKDQNGIITKYTMRYSGIERDTNILQLTFNTSVMYFSRSVVLSDLEEHTTYMISLKSHTVIGPGPETTETILTAQSSKYPLLFKLNLDLLYYNPQQFA